MEFRRALAVVLFIAACAPSRAPQDARGADGPAPPPAPPVTAAPAPAPDGGDAQADTSLLARLEHEVEDLTHAEGCATGGACRTAPIGSRPCGGPRAYIVYCPATTDSAALFAKLAELARAEEAFNRTSGMVSTCEYRDPPNVAVQGGRCVATAPDELRAQ
jgi:hypothetical protein